MKNIAYIAFTSMLVIVMMICSCNTPAATPESEPSTSSSTTEEQYIEQESTTPDKGQYEPAFQDLSKAIQLDPRDAKNYYERSKIYAFNREFEKAIADCDKAIELNPTYKEAYNVRGYLYIWENEYDKAITDLNKVVGLEASEEESSDLRRIIDSIVPPGELVLLDMACFSEGGIDCQGNVKPYNNTIQIQMFINPGESGIEVDKIYFDPPIGGRANIISPIRHFSNPGLQYLVPCISSTDPPASASACSIDYRSKSDSSYKKSNELTNTKLYVKELVCPSQLN